MEEASWRRYHRGITRRPPGGNQEEPRHPRNTRRLPDGTQEAFKRQPGGTQETPKRRPGDTLEAPRTPYTPEDSEIEK